MENIQTYQPLLFSIAYRLTGYASQAEDIVQEAYLRYQQVDQATIHSPKSYLTTIVTNLSLNYLKSAQREREEYIGVWLPEPLLTALPKSDSPEEKYEQQESLSIAFLVLLERLSPPERAVFLLHEVFDYSLVEIAEIIEKTPEHCRQLFHRAKNHLAEKRHRISVSSTHQRQLTESFVAACQSGNLAALTKLLASDVTAWADGGGKVRARLAPISGQEQVAKRFMVGLMHRVPADTVLFIEEINGAPAILCWSDSHLNWVLTLDIRDHVIVGLYTLVNPDKLAFLQRQLESRPEPFLSSSQILRLR
ncbi:RNA polymerase sigma-70 factor [Dictyobacter arantiisoli]|uniref:DNA-directed RNA polymerase sigma-70 factor n=1 Tax=Dictyobacter arantiisoli TaxID=2014874 RepID=A0A5A5TIK0_9CHLR|nr:RNA polymerase sigma-70 factor [Dictyobacter arantiisoli]GCF11431.1 DNA-directed RNA polymerase sigma-70 factor [Dictyobacter arantiisoli]